MATLSCICVHSTLHLGYRSCVGEIDSCSCMTCLLPSLMPSCPINIHVLSINLCSRQSNFSGIFLHLVCLLPSSHGSSHVMSITDKHTRWPYVIPMTSTTANSCVAAVLGGPVRCSLPPDFGPWLPIYFCSLVRHCLIPRF